MHLFHVYVFIGCIALVSIRCYSKPTTRIGHDFGRMQIDPHNWANQHAGVLKSSSFPQGCKNKPADILVCFDTSLDVSPAQLSQQQTYASELLNLFYFKHENTRVSAVSFGGKVRTVLPFVSSSKEHVQKRMRYVPMIMGKRNILSTIRYMANVAFTHENSRQGVGHIAILFIGGDSDMIDKSISEAINLMTSRGVYIYLVKIGHISKKKDLLKIASSPASNFFFDIQDRGIVRSLSDILDVHFCNVQIHPSQTPSKSPKCVARRPVDVIFSVDDVSIGARHSQKIIHLIEALVSAFDSKNDNIKIAISNGRNINFGRFQRNFETTSRFMQKLGTVRIPDHSEVLKKSRRMAFRGRRNAQKTIVHFIDHNVDINKNTLVEAKKNRYSKLDTYVVSVGLDVDVTSLKYIASRPSEDFIINVPHYQQLVGHWQSILHTICRGW